MPQANKTPIKLNGNATAPEPTREPPQEETPATPGKPPLEMALDRLKVAKRKDAETALKVYRAHAESLSNDVRLSIAEMEALAHACEVLKLTPDDLRSDVHAIIAKRSHVAALANADKLVAELEPQQKDWKEEEQRIQERLVQIRILRHQVNGAHSTRIIYLQAQNEGLHKNPRVLKDFAAALEGILQPPKAHESKIIRSNGEHQAPGQMIGGVDVGFLG